MINVIPRAQDPQNLEQSLTLSIALLADFSIITDNIIQVIKQKDYNSDLAHIEIFLEAATPYINSVKTYLELMQKIYIDHENQTTVHKDQ